MLNGVLWVLCSGAAWRDMLERFGPWSTVYQRFRDWRNRETFDQMLKRLHIRLNEQGLIDLETWMINSTAIRATRASSGAGSYRMQLVIPLRSMKCKPGLGLPGLFGRPKYRQRNIIERMFGWLKEKRRRWTPSR